MKSRLIDYTDRSNFGGTFSFYDLESFVNSQPFRYTVNLGDPRVTFKQHEAAYFAIKRAVDIDPAPITIVWAGVTAHTARRYGQAITHYRWALEFDPDLAWAHMYMAQTLEQMGHLTEAHR